MEILVTFPVFGFRTFSLSPQTWSHGGQPRQAPCRTACVSQHKNVLPNYFKPLNFAAQNSIHVSTFGIDFMAICFRIYLHSSPGNIPLVWPHWLSGGRSGRSCSRTTVEILSVNRSPLGLWEKPQQLEPRSPALGAGPSQPSSPSVRLWPDLEGVPGGLCTSDSYRISTEHRDLY